MVSVLALVAVFVFCALSGPSGADAAGAKGPKLVQLYYAESDDGSSRPFALDAYLYRADAVRFTARYDGERASGVARYEDGVTDTNIHATGEARHPWELVRQDGGQDVIRLVRDSLAERGVAKVRVRARGDGRHLDVAVQIRLSECSLDPPFYPVSCEVEA